VRAGLAAAGIGFVLAPRLVRGFDYYTHTTFEFVPTLVDNAQSTILGGGRYDGLVEELGGPPTPGIGFGSGIALLVALLLSLLTAGALWAQLVRLMEQVENGSFKAVDFDNFDQFF
jgi:histidyl-tRNA synthetase